MAKQTNPRRLNVESRDETLPAGVVDADCSYTVERLALIMGGCHPKTILKFLSRHGYRPAEIARGYHWVSGRIWNLCIDREMERARETMSETPSQEKDNQ